MGKQIVIRERAMSFQRNLGFKPNDHKYSTGYSLYHRPYLLIFLCGTSCVLVFVTSALYNTLKREVKFTIAKQHQITSR